VPASGELESLDSVWTVGGGIFVIIPIVSRVVDFVVF